MPMPIPLHPRLSPVSVAPAPVSGHLTPLPGKRNRPALVTLPLSEHDELHIELATARTERLEYTAVVRRVVRLIEAHVASGRYVSAGTSLVALEKLNEREALRARSAGIETCACGKSGMNHRDADSDALAEPKRVAA